GTGATCRRSTPRSASCSRGSIPRSTQPWHWPTASRKRGQRGGRRSGARWRISRRRWTGGGGSSGWRRSTRGSPGRSAAFGASGWDPHPASPSPPFVSLGTLHALIHPHATHTLGGGRRLKVVTIGGGPAGLYFALLMKKADPRHQVTVLERNRPDDTFGWG